MGDAAPSEETPPGSGNGASVQAAVVPPVGTRPTVQDIADFKQRKAEEAAYSAYSAEYTTRALNAHMELPAQLDTMALLTITLISTSSTLYFARITFGDMPKLTTSQQFIMTVPLYLWAFAHFFAAFCLYPIVHVVKVGEEDAWHNDRIWRKQCVLTVAFLFWVVSLGMMGIATVDACATA